MFLIKNATVIDPNTSFSKKAVDILIQEGKIQEIGEEISHKTAKTITGNQLKVSIGWLDIGAQVGEPGFEHREDLQTVAAAAASGGFTDLACFPNTNPTIHSKSEVLFLKNNSTLVNFHPIGAVSRDCEGQDLAELYDMSANGAVAFSDGSQPIASAGLMKRGLHYLKGIDGLLINHPHDVSLGKGGQLHEGAVSTKLGMKGIPALAEVLMLKRDLDLLAYTNSRLHVHNISTAESVQLIKTAKAQGLKVTASVSIMNLIFDHHVLEDFNAYFKVLPPLREKSDLQALWKGLKEGTIDIINSNHVPLEIEAKKLEFAYADFGAIGLATTYSLLNTHFGDKLSEEEIVQLLAQAPRKILGLPIPTIEEGKVANLTIFDTQKTWTLDRKDLKSKAKNTPLLGHQFTGKVIGVINGKFSNL